MKYINKLDSTKRLLYFFYISQKIKLKNLFFAKEKNDYLFILSPPFCGSTILTQIISSSKNVSCNNNIGLREGQHLPKAKDILFTDNRWQKNKKIDWNNIKLIWHKYWDLSKQILIEKSPPNIIRTNDITQTFHGVKFICLVRNPYAQIQSNIRRYDTETSQATLKYIDYLKYQKTNYENNDAILIKYEELTENPQLIKKQIFDFFPALKDIKMDIKFSAHNIRNKKELHLTNLNQESISLLTANQIETINNILIKEKSILDFFNYTIIKK